MIYAHFAKLNLENIFIHHLSGKLMSINRMMWQILFYWVGLGGIVGFSIFNPDYVENQN
jgi:hypothetical protein